MVEGTLALWTVILCINSWSQLTHSVELYGSAVDEYSAYSADKITFHLYTRSVGVAVGHFKY